MSTKKHNKTWKFIIIEIIWFCYFNSRRFCQDNGIVFVAFSPLGSPDLPWGEKLPHILADPVINKVHKNPFNKHIFWICGETLIYDEKYCKTDKWF